VNLSGTFAPRPVEPVARLRAYDPGHDLPALRARFGANALAELGSNESPIGPSRRVIEALAMVDATTLLRYPDPLGLRLRTALAATHGVNVDEVVLGNGSHELLMLLGQCFAGPGDEVVFSEFGFAVFAIATAAVGATPVRVPALSREARMPRGHDLEALASAVRSRTRLVFVANPNNPTGTTVTRVQLADFFGRIPADVPVVVDEAYAEYIVDPEVCSALELRERFPNLIVTRTFSKAYGLAGLRIGYAIADRKVVEIINRLRESFNVNAIGLALAEAALEDPAHVAHVRDVTRIDREHLASEFRRLGLFVHPSSTNFVLVDFGRDATGIERQLLASGVVVRPMGGYGLPTCLRINTGTGVDHERLLAAVSGALA
jgi:histidinol-phosphate aminotransferase